MLIDKTLVVTGERAFLRRPWPFGWKLTDPEAFTELPVRAEYSFGGQCRVYAGQAESNRIQAKHRLNPQQLAAHPDASASPELCPVAHSVFEANPFGLGFIESWFLDATRLEKIPVPRIENPHTPLTPEFFQKCLTGKISQDSLAGYIASFGVRPKFHPERRRLTGTIDQAFIASEKWLPEDFDFGIWNAAQLDQQIEFLVGDEIIELTNLCTDDLPSCRKNRESDNILELKLPNYRPYALIRFQSGRLAPAILNLDTLMIEPEFIKVSLTYRLILPFDESVRIMEARQITLQQWKELLKIDAG